MLAGKGVRAVAVMWLMTFLSLIFVPLRMYTRIYIVKAVGIDDHVFNLAWVSLAGPSLTFKQNAEIDPGISTVIHSIPDNCWSIRLRTTDC